MNEKKKKRQTTELAAQLAPLEEQQTTSPQTEQNGVILISSKENKKLPAGLSDEEPDNTGAFRIDNIVIFVLLGALAFIGLIAFMISQMPEQK